MKVALFSESTVSTCLTLGNVPPARVGPSLTSCKSKLHVFGGRLITPAKISNELYSFDLNTVAWELVSANGSSPTPEPRYFHASVVYENYLVVIGGQGEPTPGSSSKLLNDICFYNFHKKEWEIHQFDTGVFPARYAHLASVSGKTLVIVGGQDADNQYLTDLYVFNLETRFFTKICSTSSGLGSYRSTLSQQTPTSFVIFNNTRFNRPIRELIFIDLEGRLRTVLLSDFEGQAEAEDQAMPPAFRFPEGYAIGNKLVISGTYLSNNVQSYCIFSLDLQTRAWTRVDTGSCFARGSWNRGILHPSSNSFIVFGHREREIGVDYSQRRINFNHISIVNLEAFNIYRTPVECTDEETIKLGLQLMYEPRFSNFSLTTNDDFRIHINTGFLRSRWENFDTFLYSRPEQNNPLPYFKPNSLLLQESYAVVQAFVRYLYTNTLSSSSEHDIDLLGKLLVFSSNYAVHHLSDLVASRLHNLLNIDVAPRLFQVASLAKRDGLKLRSLSLMVQDRLKLMNSREFWTEYPSNLRKEILLYMPTNFQPNPHLMVETVSPKPRSSLSSSKIDYSSISVPESLPSSSRPSFESTTESIVDSKPNKNDSGSSLFPKKKVSGSSFLKFGSRRPSLANLLGFSSTTNPSQSPKPPASSSSASSTVPTDLVQTRKRAGSASTPSAVINSEDHILQSLYDFGLS